MDSEDDRLRRQAIDIFLDQQERPDDPTARAARERFLARGPAERRAYASVLRTWSAAKPEAQRTSRGMPAAVALAALALAAAIMAGPGALDQLRADHATGPGETRLIDLASGDRVHLDASSAIVDRTDPRLRRIVLLSGAAHFETADEPRLFVVEAGGVTARPVGTAFVVEMSGGGVRVAVAEGQVEAARGTETVLAKAGETVRVSAGGALLRGAIDPDAVAAWREDRLVLTDAPLSALADAVDRRLSGRVVLPDESLAAARVTGVFSLVDPVGALRLGASLHGGSVIAAPPFVTVVLALPDI